ncbi:MAG TPA: iron-sulfur cluster biosynthesis transcriptional regulator SufR, partial [Coleofasciculaceae cyanobacterium]
MKGKRSLKQRLNKLVELRTHEGYMAEVQAQVDGSFLLIENHCPICAAAMVCTGLCAKELEVFQAILGDDTHIQRVEHIISGERRCAYQISH